MVCGSVKELCIHYIESNIRLDFKFDRCQIYRPVSVISFKLQGKLRRLTWLIYLICDLFNCCSCSTVIKEAA